MSWQNNNNGGNYGGGGKARLDQFNQPYQNVACKLNKNGFPVGYVTIGNKRYKIEPGQAKAEGVEMWVRITQVKNRPKVSL